MPESEREEIRARRGKGEEKRDNGDSQRESKEGMRERRESERGEEEQGLTERPHSRRVLARRSSTWRGEEASIKTG